jgi:methyl-accepting chemotaxis protein
MRGVALDDRSTVFAFRGILFLAMLLMLVHSRRQNELFELAPFALAFFHLFTSFILWRAPDARLQTATAQSAAFLWDMGVTAALMYFSEGFDDELYLMFFLILFMSAMLTEVWQSFLIGGVASLLYAGLWAKGKTAVDLPTVNLCLRFAFFFAASFFTAIMAARVRAKDERHRKLEMRLALEKLANGGWGVRLTEDLDPEVAKSVRAVNAVMDNLARALERVVAKNEQLRDAAGQALIQLAHEKERLESQGRSPVEPPPPSA